MILLVGDSERADVRDGIAHVEPLVRKLAADVVVDPTRDLDLGAHPPRFVINFGGDGSILHVARRMGATQAPILGVNFGKFGFLAEFELPELLDTLEQAVAGELPLRRSLMLKVGIRRDGETHEHFAVNDVVLQRIPDGRMSNFVAGYNGEQICSYYGDGLILSTPLGSTAHNLSAGGPILHPELDAVVMTPICAHLMSIRPLTLPASGAISVRVEPDEDINVTLDGLVTERLKAGDAVLVEKAPQPVTLVAHPKRSYFDTLRLKFGWSERGLHQRP